MPIQDEHPQYTKRKKQWQKVLDCVEGADAVKQPGKYLPQPPAMSNKRYTGYLARAQFYEVTDRTLWGLTGAMFQEEPTLTGPDNLLKQKDDLENRGLPFNAMARRIGRNLISVGRIGALVDPGPDDSIGVVPRIALYDAPSITDWDQALVNGRYQVARVVLREHERQDEKSSKLQYRELILVDGVYEVRVYRKADDSKDEFVIDPALTKRPTARGTPMNEIPFVFFGTNDLDPDVEKPPLLALANENIAHFQMIADYRNALYLGGQPTPWVTGFTKDEKPSALGTGEMWAAEDPNAKVGMLEFEGKTMSEARNAIMDSEGRMVLLGARFFEPTKSGVEAAEAIRLRFSADSATLTTIAQTEGEGLTKLLTWADEIAGIAGDVSVTLPEEFVDVSMTPDELNATVKAWQGGAFPWTDLFALMKKGNVIAQDREEDEVRADLETEAPRIPPSPPVEPDDEDEPEDLPAAAE